MHRSGTSATARVLSLLGAALPRSLMPASADNNELGFWESTRLEALHEELLGQLGSPWHDLRPLPEAWFAGPAARAFRRRLRSAFLDEFGDSPIAVVKDPRLCRLLPLWLEMVASLPAAARVVIPYRHPLEVAASLQARDGLSPRRSLLLWLQHVLLAERASRGLPRCFVAYDELVADPAGVVERMTGELSMRWPRSPAEALPEIQAFLSGQHKHQAWGALASSDALGLSDEAYQRLERLVGELGRGDTAALDRARESYEDAVRLLGPLLDEVEADRLGLRQERDRLQEQQARDRQQREQLSGQVANLSQESAARQRALEAAAVAFEQQAGLLRLERERHRDALGAVERADAERGEAVARLEARARELESLRDEQGGLEQSRSGPDTVHRAAADATSGLAAAAASTGGPAPPPAAALKPGLRERLKRWELLRRLRGRPPAGCLLHADSVAPIPGQGLFVSGWAVSAGREMTGLRLQVGRRRTPEGLATAGRPPRPDVLERFREVLGLSAPVRGFSAFFPFPGMSHRRRPLKLLVEWSDGATTRHPLDWTPASADAALRAALGTLQDRHLPYAGGLELMPALDSSLGQGVEAAWRSRRRSRRPPREVEFGSPPASPALSIVVPVYGRLDLVEHQLAGFAGDASLRECELIYVLDDPRLLDAAERCEEWGRLYGVPLRVIQLEENRGFSGACNAGAAAARSELLFFLNSDVMSREHGWAAALLETFRSLPEAGALGIRLLWEDASIQHLGMGFLRHPLHGIWLNTHPLKGVAGGAALPERPFEAPAVTGAALMVAKPLFDRLGGFDEDYVVGGYEDSDLCLKLLQAGRRVWVAPGVAMHHLEGRSQLGHEGASSGAARMWYNAWLQHRRWGAFLDELASRQAYAGAGLPWFQRALTPLGPPEPRGAP